MRIQKVIALTCICMLALTCYRGDDFNWEVKWLDYNILLENIKVIFANEEFVATGVVGRGYKSSNGVNWNEMPTGGYRIDLWVNGQYIALGYGISISPDAVTWTNTLKTYPIELHDIIWDNSQYVVVGDAGTIITSPDALTWKTIDSGFSEDLYNIDWVDGNYYLYVTGDLFTSTDLINWVLVEFPDVIFPKHNNKPYVYEIIRGKSSFVAIGSPNSFYSSDGITWSNIEPAFYIEQITWCDGSLQYVGVKSGGGWFDAPRIYTSVDGKTWYEHLNAKYAGDMFFHISFNSIACHGDAYVAGGTCEGAFFESYSCLMHSP